jgi:hypothetical protein
MTLKYEVPGDEETKYTKRDKALAKYTRRTLTVETFWIGDM